MTPTLHLGNLGLKCGPTGNVFWVTYFSDFKLLHHQKPHEYLTVSHDYFPPHTFKFTVDKGEKLSKVIPVHAMKAHRESCGIGLLSLDLSSRYW
jgi:hypothetical protein